MRLIFFLLISVALLGCSDVVPEDNSDVIKNQKASQSLLSSMGEILKSAYNNNDPACTVEKRNTVCDLDLVNCDHSEFFLTTSGSNCPTTSYFRNETKAISGGARGTFSWTVTTLHPENRTGSIKSIFITGTQEYKTQKKNDGDEILGRVKLEGQINTEKDKYTFIIDGRDKLSTARQNNIGQSEIELIFLGDSYRVVLKENAGFDANRKTQTINYFLDNKVIDIAQFRLFSELGITFFFKSTPASAERPWLGYVGPIKDYLQLPKGL